MTAPSGGQPSAGPDKAIRTTAAAPEAAQASDSTLRVLERAQAGDKAAVAVLMERALWPIRRWAHGRLPQYARRDADTEDVVQDAVVRTLKRITRFQHRTVGGLQAYLRQAVVNRIRDLIRASTRRGARVDLDPELRDWTPSPLEAAILHEQLDRFLEGLRALRPADRQVIVWRLELGYSVEEIATKLGKSKAAAGMTVSRAVARLAEQMRLPTDPPA